MNDRQNNRQFAPVAQGLHIVAKPIGPACNLDCAYCFYLEKQALFGTGEDYRMPDEVLAVFIRSYIAAQPTPVVEFVWQGGSRPCWGSISSGGWWSCRRLLPRRRPSATPCRPMARCWMTNGAAS